VSAVLVGRGRRITALGNSRGADIETRNVLILPR
jgi:hypothetical protein